MQPGFAPPPDDGQSADHSDPGKALRRALWTIMLAVAAWGVYHAIGAYRFNHNPMRAVMVLGCVAAYLGFWGLMLASRRARLARESKSR